MEKMKVFLPLLLGSFLMLFSCQKDQAPLPTAEKMVINDGEPEFSNQAELIEYYLRTIEEQKKIGSSVVFQDGNNFIENPTRDWLEKHLSPTAGEDCQYCYQFEYRADTATASANYEAWGVSPPGLLWTQSVTHPAGGWPAHTIYVSPWHCPAVDTPPCIRILWDMATVTGASFCDYFKVRVCKPSGATQSISTVNYPIPSTDNMMGPWCPTAEECCDIELVQECVQDENGCWYTQMTMLFNGVPIVRGDPNSPCKTNWDIIPPINHPTTCAYPPFPWQNNNPILFPECTNWMVTIVCGDCTYQEMGITNCFADCGG